MCVLSKKLQVGLRDLAGKHADNQHGDLLYIGLPNGIHGAQARQQQVRAGQQRAECLGGSEGAAKLAVLRTPSRMEMRRGTHTMRSERSRAQETGAGTGLDLRRATHPGIFI